jgi:hypothetical protein
MSQLHKAIILVDTKYTPLNLQVNEIPPETNKIVPDPDKLQKWSQKALHGRYSHELNQDCVDKTTSHAWLTRSDMFPETGGFMCAIMDQVISTNNYKKYILKGNTQHTDLCRHCHKESETIHVTGARSQLVPTDYKHRHDQVAKIIHQKLANKHSLLSKIVPYYKYTPDVILENETHKLYWDRTLITDKTIYFNRPDKTLVEKTENIVYFIYIYIYIYIYIPNNHNLQAKHTEKLTKYSELAFEIKTQWRMDTILTIL